MTWRIAYWCISNSIALCCVHCITVAGVLFHQCFSIYQLSYLVVIPSLFNLFSQAGKLGGIFSINLAGLKTTILSSRQAVKQVN